MLNSKLKVAVLLSEEITYIRRIKIICDKAFDIVREAFLDKQKNGTDRVGLIIKQYKQILNISILK